MTRPCMGESAEHDQPAPKAPLAAIAGGFIVGFLVFVAGIVAAFTAGQFMWSLLGESTPTGDDSMSHWVVWSCFVPTCIALSAIIAAKAWSVTGRLIALTQRLAYPEGES
ncbi:hypothetical protein [Mycobacteroides abscessus]|uniref:hypothetical protein n=1 Tax=Mycobacteroides abscessus TaxID=36809 RepID=UPI0010425FFA|nr:hypothetical protein [Mycobacteroides abscessus]MBN7428799.1 hypothetical protein [Mycobacteroides abscessus subsp. massiliense]